MRTRHYFLPGLLVVFILSGILAMENASAANAYGPLTLSASTLTPTETKIFVTTATSNSLTPTVTRLPATTTKPGGGPLSSGSGWTIYLPISVLQALPTPTPRPTFTPPAAPSYALSQYMSTVYIDSTDYDALYNLGRKRGGCDGGPAAHPDSFVILSFGIPWDDRDTHNGVPANYGVALYPDTATKMTISQLESNMKGFIWGYYGCVSSINPSASLTVGLGINSSAVDETGKRYITSAHGQAWAQLVDRLNDYLEIPPSWESTIKVVGAADFEPGWGNKARVRQWVDGYSAVDNSQYFFFGTCDGCPVVNNDFTAGYVAPPIAGDWTMDDLWYVAYGAPPAWPVPEIYRVDHYHARQWQNLSLYAATCNLLPGGGICEPHASSYGNGKISFSGAMTQYQACVDLGNDCDPDQTNSPPVGWQQLWQALKDPNTPLTNQSALLWITDIGWTQ